MYVPVEANKMKRRTQLVNISLEQIQVKVYLMFNIQVL